LAGDVEFRYRTMAYAIAWVALAVAACLALLIGAAGGVLSSEIDLPPWLAYWIAAVLGFIAWLVFRTLQARRLPSAWLARMTPAGLAVKFRSYLNHHLPDEDEVVVLIPYREMASVGLCDETRTLPARGRHDVAQQRHSRLLEIELDSADVPRLREQLAAERNRKSPMIRRWWGGRSSSLWRHYPVRLHGESRLRIEWSGAIPGAKAAVEMLASLVKSTEARHREADFANLDGLSTSAVEDQILELAERGDVIPAVRVTCEAFGMNATEARAFVDGLLGRDAPGDLDFSESSVGEPGPHDEMLHALAQGERVALGRMLRQRYGLSMRETLRVAGELCELDERAAQRYLQALDARNPDVHESH